MPTNLFDTVYFPKKKKTETNIMFIKSKFSVDFIEIT